MPIASVPPGANRTFRRSPGASVASFAARRTAYSLVKRRGEKGSVLQRVLHRCEDARMAVADLVRAVSVEVHDAPALHILQPDP